MVYVRQFALKLRGKKVHDGDRNTQAVYLHGSNLVGQMGTMGSVTEVNLMIGMVEAYATEAAKEDMLQAASRIGVKEK